MCEKCHFGFVLEAADDVAPSDADPFLVVDRRLAICGLSKTAERLLGTSETTALQSAASLYFALAHDDSGSFERRLRDAVGDAIERDATSLLSVRAVRAGSGGDVAAQMRVGACGSPPAAVLVLLTPTA